ncbi:MAG TPA: hypothetical protein VM261_27545 [Kofleriaceae bacterium]|nr:hypothetical protein [Kofleriaceae bacterium]
MRTTSTIFASLVGSLGLFATACDPGSVDTGNGTDELLCSTSLTMVGTFAVGTPKPAEINGCWPIGTWTFAATVGEGDCTDMPAPLAEYAIRVDRNLESEDPDFSWLYTYVTDPADMTASIDVTSGGGGLCEATVMLFSADGKRVWNMHPALQADNSVTGIGDYEVHTTDQVPAEDP